MSAERIVSVLRTNPGAWALVKEGGPVPDGRAPNMPSREILDMAREVWEAQGPWAPLGAFDVAIRNNDLYIMYRAERDVSEPVHVYTKGACFECGRPAAYLVVELATKVCLRCGEDLRREHPDAALWSFVTGASF